MHGSCAIEIDVSKANFSESEKWLGAATTHENELCVRFFVISWLR